MDELTTENEALKKRVAELERLVFVPGMHKCAKCQFVLISNYISASTGNVWAKDDPEQCPNCDVPLWRVTERDAGNEVIERANEYLERAVRAEEALKPFANFADKNGRMPSSMPITSGSSLAKQQLTMGDCYQAVEILKGRAQ